MPRHCTIGAPPSAPGLAGAADQVTAQCVSPRHAVLGRLSADPVRADGSPPGGPERDLLRHARSAHPSPMQLAHRWKMPEPGGNDHADA
jgi:hypothetical protein